MKNNEHFDVIIVGAGSSGGVVASRISENSSRRVLLLDAGPDFPDEESVCPEFEVSGEHSWLVCGIPEMDWGYYDPDRSGRRGGRAIRLPRGKLVGGCSMVNSTIAVRPASFDMDRWASLGCTGYNWDQLLPYFIRIERDLNFGSSPLHGNTGLITIQRYDDSTWTPINRLFAEGCQALDIPRVQDLNGLNADCGVYGSVPHNRWQEVRQGTLVTYIRAARKRKNLTIRGGYLVDRVCFDGNRATGVYWIGPNGPGMSTADLIVLSSGVYNTPAILQRSGIGNAELLRRLGIPVVCDAKTVGCNLRDHPGVLFVYKANEVISTHGRLFGTLWRGPAGPHGEPKWEIQPIPMDESENTGGFWTFLCRQESTGTVEIVSKDPNAPPLIDHNYLSAQKDLDNFDDALKACQALLETPPFQRHHAVSINPTSDLSNYLHTRISSANHQNGSCRMGSDPDSSVVDPRFRVHGTERLMVVDASVFPDTVMHNINLTCCVLGEIAADVITGKR